MHKQQIDFIERTKERFHEYFGNYKHILDVGSLDVNGTNRVFFDSSIFYTGIDIGKGKNVDIVCSVHEFKASEKWDVVICTEMLEHDRYFELSITRMIEFMRDYGLLIITAAGPGRIEHGTKRFKPEDSPFTNDYYRPVTFSALNKALNPEVIFSQYQFEVNREDVYFWGIN